MTTKTTTTYESMMEVTDESVLLASLSRVELIILTSNSFLCLFNFFIIVSILY